MDGFNVKITVGGKTLLGRTQEDLTISAITKESLTKDDKGAKRIKVTGHDVSLKVSGLVDEQKAPAVGGMTRDEVMAIVMKEGTGAEVELQYMMEGCQTYGGKAIIMGYNEGSNATDDATYGLDLKISGKFTVLGK